jgi:hypothetical protein
MMESHPLILLAPVRETSHNDLHETFLGYDDFAETGEQIENTSLYSTPYPSLPPFDRSSTTASACIAGLALSGFATIGSLIGGLCILCNSTTHFFYQVPLPTAGAEATSLVVNILVALLTDSMGYIHATSLRWALYREDRLKFNTNIRLFNSARKSAPNRWPANFCWIISLILCYAATSQMFVHGHINSLTTNTHVNGVALLALAFGLFVQVALSTWCLFSTSRLVSTWSSNPLNNCLALLHGTLEHTPGRCMLSVHQANMVAQPKRPSERQKSARLTKGSVLYVIVLLWVLAVLAFLWAVTLALVSRNVLLFYAPGDTWTFTPSWFRVFDDDGINLNSVLLEMTPNPRTSYSAINFPLGVQVILGILFVFAIQGAQTLGLHCVELLVNISRDEDAWRCAYPEKLKHSRQSIRGAKLSSNAFKLAATSWQNAVLFISKALLHWLLGQSLSVNVLVSAGHYSYEFDMIYMRVFVFGIVATALAIFTSYLAFRRPKGCQPASWGHLQTLANLVDDWNVSSEGHLWWGDKRSNYEDVRHAGTSGTLEDIGQIHMHALYAG